MTQIKMFGAIPRLPSVTPEWFHDHYRHPHGTMGRTISIMRAYTQSHQIHSDLLGPEQTHFEATAEVWIDNVADAQSFGTEPNYVIHVKPDEPLFVDLEKLQFLWAEEEVLHAGVNWSEEDADYADKLFRLDRRPISVKLLQYVIKEGSQRWDAEEDYDLGRRIGALRHVRCRPSAELHPDGAFCIGVRELYWPTQTAMEEGVVADPAAWQALLKRPAESIQYVATAERFM